MKKTAYLLILFLIPFAAIAQADKKSGEEEIFNIVEKMPQFPGGQEALTKYLTENLKYPESAIAGNVEGVVYIQFIVNSTGEITNVKVLRGIHPDCDSEAMRVVSTMPRWEPGTQNNKPVKVRYNLPIRFKLS